VIRASVDRGLERRFRELAMKRFGYAKGSLQKAAAQGERALGRCAGREGELEMLLSLLGGRRAARLRSGCLKPPPPRSDVLPLASLLGWFSAPVFSRLRAQNPLDRFPTGFAREVPNESRGVNDSHDPPSRS